MKKISLILLTVFILSGCGNKSDIKDNFCGLGIDARYCKCAFHGEYCENLGMSKGEAKDHVYEKYDEWKNPDLDKLKEECAAKNGAFFGRTCMLCKNGETVVDNKCVVAEDSESEESAVEEGECKYDNECPATCEGNIKWKRGCNARTNTCENTFDTNCSSDVETFGEFAVSKICTNGECVRDEKNINQKRSELEAIKKNMSDEVKAINAQRDDLKNVMLDANKNCINGIADMTNVAILEFSTRIASVMAGGFPDIASASVDYVSDALNKISAAVDTEAPEDKKLKPEEYIKLNCDLYKHFSDLLAATDDELESSLKSAEDADEQLKLLP
jgi:hypothetical protein